MNKVFEYLKKIYQTNNKELEYSSNHLQLPRRLFHMVAGFIVGTVYLLFFEQKKLASILGTVSLIVYLLDHIRLQYPNLANKFNLINRYFLRKEESTTHSAALPYSMALLFLVIGTPKAIAIISIYTLAFSDPLAAIVGISIGGHAHKLFGGNKTYEGTLTFFATTLIIAITVFSYLEIDGKNILSVSLFASTIVTIIEAIPSKLDDNITIPISMALTLRLLFTIFPF